MAPFASSGDAILLIDSYTDEEMGKLYQDERVIKNNLKLIPIKELDTIAEDITFIMPWGWNSAIANLLESNGIDKKLLPNQKRIDNIRRLSHRRTTITFNKILNSLITDFKNPLPVELRSEDEIKVFMNLYEKIYLKQPWSSAGRGVVNNISLNEKLLLEWARGCIRKQGSVIGEKAFDKKAEFATEWVCFNGVVEFLGFSMFYTNNEGRYLSNIIGNQKELSERIKAVSPSFDHNLIVAQREAIERIIAPFYDGPLGIDMMTGKDNTILPCMEINLRLTMGHVAIKESKLNLNSSNRI